MDTSMHTCSNNKIITNELASSKLPNSKPSKLSAAFFLFSMMSYPAVLHAEDALEFTIEKQGRVVQHQVAFVPFAGDTAISNVVLQDLKTTSLKTTSDGLIQQPHSSTELSATLPAWQNLGIPYLVVGSTSSDRGNTVVNFEVIEVGTGNILGQQTMRGKDKREIAHQVSSRIYELITGKKQSDLNASIAYIVEKQTSNGKDSALYISDSDGENPRLLTTVQNASIYRPAASPDGRYIAYSVQKKNQRAGLYIIDINSKLVRKLVDIKGSNLSPSFSYTGNEIIFTSNVSGDHDIYSIGITGGAPRRIVKLPLDQVQPSFAKDGSFVFASDHESPKSNTASLYRRYPSGAITRISRGGYAADPSVSPDGSKIGYLNGRSAAIMSNTGAVIANLGNTGIDEAPSFSPSSERVVYSQGANTSTLVIRSLEGGQSISKRINGTVRSPVWVPSSK